MISVSEPIILLTMSVSVCSLQFDSNINLRIVCKCDYGANFQDKLCLCLIELNDFYEWCVITNCPHRYVEAKEQHTCAKQHNKLKNISFMYIYQLIAININQFYSIGRLKSKNSNKIMQQQHKITILVPSQKVISLLYTVKIKYAYHTKYCVIWQCGVPCKHPCSNVISPSQGN